MTSPSMQFASARPFQSLVSPMAEPSRLQTAPALPVERSSTPALPSADQPLSLNSWRGRKVEHPSERMEMREKTLSTAVQRVFELGLPGAWPGDEALGRLTRAIAVHVARRCPKADIFAENGRLVIEQPFSVSNRALDGAVDEVRTLLAFIQMIGGDVEHACCLLHQQPDIVAALHHVFGEEQQFFAPGMAGGFDLRNERKLKPNLLRMLSDWLAAEERPDLQLAMLDVALPQCDGPGRGRLCEQWIALAGKATAGPGNFNLKRQQRIARALLRKAPEALGPRERNSLVLLSGNASMIVAEKPATDRDFMGRTPLMRACAKGDVDRVSYLIEKGAAVEARDELGRTALIWACKRGHVAVVQILLAAGAQIDAMDELGQTALMNAEHFGHGKVAELLRGAEQDSTFGGSVGSRKDTVAKSGLTPDKDGRTELMLACEGGDLGAVERLLDSEGTDLVSRDLLGKTPLHFACGNGHVGIVKALLARDADIEALDNRDRTPLISASQQGHEAVVALLIQKKAKVDAVDARGATALSYACGHGLKEVIGLLLAAGADPDRPDRSGRTPAMIAKRAGYRDIVAIHRSAEGPGSSRSSASDMAPSTLTPTSPDGARQPSSLWSAEGLGSPRSSASDLAASTLTPEFARQPSISGEGGMTAMMEASAAGELAIVHDLVAAGSDLHGADDNGWTALMFAANGGHVELVEWLFARGADLESKNSQGQTALILASHAGQVEVVRSLTARGAKVEVSDSNGVTPLIAAASIGQTGVVKHLMGLGADAERGNAQGMTAMMMACQSGHLAVLKSMLARKANIECRDKNGWTPLMHAAENGHLELVKALLAIGADRKAKDASGRTALELARNKGHKRIETELKKPRFSLRRSATVDHRRLDL